MSLKVNLIEKWLGFWVSLLLNLLTAGRAKPDPQRMQRLDFRTSTQRMGLRFTERLRDRWRRKWLKLKQRDF